MSAEESPQVHSRDHYAYVTQSAIRLFNAGALTNVTDLLVEPDYGYTARLTYDDGSFRVTYGNDLGLNPGAACDLAKDKGHAKFMLREIGVNTPAGKEFLLPWWAAEIGATQRARGNTDLQTTDSIAEYLETSLGYPAYIKPVTGSQGLGVSRVDTAEEIATAVNEFEQNRVRVAVVEEAVDMPDYRIVVLDGRLISAYLRKPLAVTGDGASTIEELIAGVQSQYIAEGRDTIINPTDARIAQRLGKCGLTLASKLPDQASLALLSVSNLSAGGTSEEVSSIIHSRWSKLAAYIARSFNLRICGVDLACEDIKDPESGYSVLEVNAAPGLDHYASAGEAQQKVVDTLYTMVLNAYPNIPH